MSTLLQGEHLTVRYGSHTVVDDFSFRLGECQWLMLAGPNGAGKSTLIEAIARGVPCAGSLRWEGRELSTFSPAALARKLGVLSQRNAVGYAYTVEEVVSLGRYAHSSGFFSGK